MAAVALAPAVALVAIPLTAGTQATPAAQREAVLQAVVIIHQLMDTPPAVAPAFMAGARTTLQIQLCTNTGQTTPPTIAA